MNAPERGDLIWMRFGPHAGREIQKTRPALVLTTAEYNTQIGLCLVCPVTSQEKGYPFEVLLPEGLPARGVVLADQIKSMDWRTRRGQTICRVSQPVLDEVLLKLVPLLGLAG